MIQHRLFAMAVVAAPWVAAVAAAFLHPSQGPNGADCVLASEDASAALGQSSAAGIVLSGSEWSAVIAPQIERDEYRVSQTAAGLEAPNRAHHLRTHFRSGGIDVSPRQRGEGETRAAWQLTWRTTKWGRPDAMIDVEPPEREPRFEGARVTYAKGAIDEWYENRKEGIEQGFTIHERPSGDGPVIVAGHLGGGVRPQLSCAESAIDLFDEHGARVLRYGALHVWDAEGIDLPSHLELEGIEVAIVINDDGAAYPLTIDPLLSSPAWTGESNQDGANFGISVATAGDVNGDGFSDVIVGAYLYDNGENNEGRAFVYHGSATGLAVTPAWTAESNQSEAQFGTSVSTAGDVNGDGFSDVIVGAPRYDNGQNDEGRVYVYYGSPGGLSVDAAWIMETDQSTAYLGQCVSTAGDVNGDGFSDVIVAAMLGDIGQSNEGFANVYHGSAVGLAPVPSWTGESNEPFTQFGTSASSAGDVNGDGYSDVIVGAPFYGNGEAGEGRVFGYLGSAGGLLTVPNWIAESNQAFAEFGASVSTAGDVNDDGYSDVIIGAYRYDNGESDEGRVFAYHGSASGLAATPAWTAESDQMGGFLGIAVGSAGDVDADGYSDVIAGAGRYAPGGRVFGYRGSETGIADIADWTVESNLINARLGYAVSTAGDVNGDGFSDVIVGAYQSGSETNEGQAFVYHGSGVGTGVEGSPSTAQRGRLDRSSPNPFVATTEITYTLPEPGPAQLAAFDVTGRRVAVLVDAFQDGGSHTLRWAGLDARGSSLPAGVYLLRLEFGGGVDTRKLVVAR